MSSTLSRLVTFLNGIPLGFSAGIFNYEGVNARVTVLIRHRKTALQFYWSKNGQAIPFAPSYNWHVPDQTSIIYIIHFYWHS